jgi:predicted MFS family arabinose efflux permease
MSRKTWNRLMPAAAALAALVVALPVAAHPGDHSHEQLVHLLSEPDHLALLLAATLVVAAAFAPRLIRAVAKRRGRQ